MENMYCIFVYEWPVTMYVNSHSFFFLTANNYSITQIWGGLGSQTGIEQPVKHKDLWKERAFIASESAISFCVLDK